LYNKFRAVSSIQVLLELLLPVMAVLGLHEFFYNEKYTHEERKKSLFYSTGIVGGILLLFLAFKNTIFSFVGPMDGYFMQELGPELVMALREDRAALMSSDTIRSLILVLLKSAVTHASPTRQYKI